MLAVALLATVVACGSKTGEMNGDIFIVTKSGENIKLGLVDVQAFPEDVIAQHLAERRSTAQAALKTVWPSWQKAVAREMHADSVEKAIEERPDVEPWVQEWEKTLSHSSRDTALFMNRPKFREYLDAVDAEGSAMTSLVAIATKVNPWRGLDYFITGLPAPLVAAKTDADGKFKLSLKRRGRYGLLAFSSRTVGDKLETYQWFVWASLDGQPSGRIFLSNDNLISVDPTDAVISERSLDDPFRDR
jgi:hypothetical protein